MNQRPAGGLASVALSLCLSAAVSAQTPTVVTNLPQPTTSGANAYQFMAVDDAIYFYADPPNDDAAVWKWTEAGGPQRMTTVVQETYSYIIPSMMAFGDKLLFSSRSTSAVGHELWISNGTALGTALLKDIHPAGSSSPAMEIVSNGKAYFTAVHPDYGRELWVTDGTGAGTTLVKDLTGDSRSASPTGFVERNGLVYFTAVGDLWVTDGTEAGTISLATGVNASRPGVIAGQVVFLGADATNGRELWSTDGTPGGTALLKDIQPGAASSWGGLGTTFAPAGASLLFFGEDAEHGRELWRTDGTAAGTELVKDITPGEASTSMDRLLASDAGAFFIVNGTELWFSDGTEAGTIPIETFPTVTRFVTAPNGAYLMVPDGADSWSLVYSDGTVAGTGEIPNAAPDFTLVLVSTGGHVLFNAADGTAVRQPWITDGTEAGTQVLTRIPISLSLAPSWMGAAGSYAYIPVGTTLYRSDGTAAGTIPVAALSPYYFSTSAALGNLFLFQTVTNGKRGLWKSDGTVAGTTLLKELEVEWIVPTMGGYALFRAYQSAVGYGLWRTDGTEAGTQLLHQLTPQATPVEIAGTAFFLDDGWYSALGYRDGLWQTGGTAETTRMIATGDFDRLGTAGGILYIVQRTPEHGAELWKSDGTADGMSLVKDIVPGTNSSGPEMLNAAGNTLVFLASTPTYGRELWRSDGTEAGTYLLRDIALGTASPNIVSMVPSGRYLYFIVDAGSSGRRLWRTDGTIAGTILLAEVTYIVTPPIAVDGKLVFSAIVAPYGYELWESDGTPAGTFVVADLVPGSGSSLPGPFGVATDLLFFSTADGKLWTRARATSRLSIADRRITEGDAGSTILQFTVTRHGSTAGAASVGYATADITATAGQDYQAASGTVSFAAGETSKQIAITILGDEVIEQNESFAVTLSGATGATVIDPHAFGIIEENDRRVALSIEYVPRASSWDDNRTFRIRNDGPSLATVTLRVSESPYASTFSCDNKNPSVCHVGMIPAGESREFTVLRGRSYNEQAVPPQSIIPGRTLTATVSAAEAENDLTDNTVARMVTRDGALSLPPYLIAGSNAQAKMAASSYSGSGTVGFTMTGGVLVSPGTATVSAANPIATFDLTVAPNAWGWSNVVVSGEPVMRVPVVLPSEPVRLDTTIVPPYVYYSKEVELGEPVSLPVTIAAVLHDGTRPSGTITLVRRADQSVVQTLTLDGNAKASFTVNDLPVGAYAFNIIYSGDDSFLPLEYGLPDLRVIGRTTSTYVAVHQNPCGVSQIVVTVKNADGHTPTGTVDITSYWAALSYLGVPLVASATSGEATATVNHTFTGTSYTAVEAKYVPTGSFEASNNYTSFYPSACPAPMLIASAASANSVSLIWSNVGAQAYDVLRAEGPSPGTFTLVGSTGTTSFNDSTAQPGKSYLYKVEAKNSAGVVRSTSALDLATTVIFSDDPIVFRSTRTKAAHILELRQAANAVRALTGQAPLTFPFIGVGMPIKASDITELRTAINNALIAAGRGSVTWVDGVGAGKPVKTLHIQQMRNVVK